MTTDTITASMWLHLLQTRKALTALQLSEVVRNKRDVADRILALCAKKGYVRGGHDPSRKNGRTYAVDDACLIPRGVALHQVMLAKGLKVTAAPIERGAVPVPQRPDTPAANRGKLGHIGQVSSVFALGGTP